MAIVHLPKPRIDFTFKGLIALVAKENHFEAGIVQGPGGQKVPGHDFFIELNDQPLFKEGDEPSYFSISLGEEDPDAESNGTVDTGITMFRPAANTSFDREHVHSSMDWLIDIDRELYDGRKVDLDEQCLPTRIRVEGVKKGLFYTTVLTTTPTRYVKHGIEHSLLGAAFEIVAEIAITRDTKLEIHNLGGASRYELLKADPGTTHTINVSNSCKDNDPECLLGSGHSALNDLIKGVGGDKFPFVIETQKVLTSTFVQGCPIVGFGKHDKLP